MNNNGYLNNKLRNPEDVVYNQELTKRLLQMVNQELPTTQMMSSIIKYKKGIFAYMQRASNIFTATDTSINIPINVDSTYWWLIYGISVTMTAATTDLLSSILSLKINNLSNFLGSAWAIQDIRQFTAKPVDFFVCVPANATLNTELYNGTTTAGNTVNVQFHGIHVPSDIAEDLLSIGLAQGSL